MLVEHSDVEEPSQVPESALSDASTAELSDENGEASKTTDDEAVPVDAVQPCWPRSQQQQQRAHRHGGHAAHHSAAGRAAKFASQPRADATRRLVEAISRRAEAVGQELLLPLHRLRMS